MDRQQASLLLGHGNYANPVTRGETSNDDFFGRARRFAAIGLVLAGSLAIAGSMLDWVRIVERPELVEGHDFEGEEVAAPKVSEPFTGLEARDGRYVLAGGLVLVLASLLLLTRGRGAGFGVLASIVIGGVTFAAYEGIQDVSSPIARRMDLVGGADAGIGLILAASGAILGMIASMAAIAASPHAPVGAGTET